MTVPALRPADSDPDQSAAIAGELHRSLVSYAEWAVREWRTLLAELEKKQAGYVPADKRDDLAQLRDLTRSAIDAMERIGQDSPGWLDHRQPADLSWRDITAEWTRDEAAGRALWGRVGHAAREELATGALAAHAVEGYQPRPMERAHFLVIREALADGLQPRNRMEWLLIDGMAQAWTMYLRWLHQFAQTDSVAAIRAGSPSRQRDEWEPPRLSEAEAVDRAMQMADRFERQFLRLMKCYRDGRKLAVSMMVMGGQVNLAGQQVVANGHHHSE